jgi:hypothetical protein
MEPTEIALIVCPSLIVTILIIIGIMLFKKYSKKKEVMPMQPIRKQVKEMAEIAAEEIEEPDMDEIETVEEGEEEEPEEPQPKQKRKPVFCMVVVEGGKAYRGEYLGEEPQLVPLQNNQLVKVDSFWLMLRTEKVELLKINRNHIILIAFENLPKQEPPKPPTKSKDVSDAESSIESIDVD